MTELVELRSGSYHDSVTLLRISQATADAAGITAAQVAMATPLNVELAAGLGFAVPAGAGPNDLLVALRGNDDAAIASGLAALEQALAAAEATGRTAGGFGDAEPPRTVRSAAARAPEASVVLLSVPGGAVIGEAMDAIAAGKHVMIFSDNVPLEHEVVLKDAAARAGVLVMGPDCGTAVIGGVGLGFANVLRAGAAVAVAGSTVGGGAQISGAHSAVSGSHSVISSAHSVVSSPHSVISSAAHPAPDASSVPARLSRAGTEGGETVSGAGSGTDGHRSGTGGNRPDAGGNRSGVVDNPSDAGGNRSGTGGNRPDAGGNRSGADGQPHNGRSMVGVIAASGTGAQQLTCLLDEAGVPVSAVLGVGGRDLSEAVGGRSALAALRMLQDDPATGHIVIVSKPPHPATAATVLAAAKASATPVTTVLLGPGQPDLTAAAETVLQTVGVAVPTWPYWSADDGIRPVAGALRGLFSGGTLADEAMLIAGELLGDIRSNIPLRPELALPKSATGHGLPHLSGLGHVIVDLGDDEFTRGRPHPMIDPTVKLDLLAAQAADPDVSVVLLDVVLGYGSEPDPAARLAPAIGDAIASAASDGRELTVIVSLCGTDGDPQNREAQATALAHAGADVYASNAHAARAAARAATGSATQDAKDQ